jgi:soluble lytic murein transglycosylase-like protein
VLRSLRNIVRIPFSGRQLLRGAALLAAMSGSLLATGAAMAGAQVNEQLSDSVRSALAAALRDRSPPEPRYVSGLEKVDWLSGMSERLPARHKPSYLERVEFLQMARYEAQRAGLDPQLVLGLIEVESNFRRHAISSAGARGYMQVMPFWTREIGDGNPAGLFDSRTNLRYGCVILRHYIDIERGDLYRALGRYNGSLGRPEYPNLVLAAWRRWNYDNSRVLKAQQAGVSPALTPASAPAPAPALTAAAGLGPVASR